MSASKEKLAPELSSRAINYIGRLERQPYAVRAELIYSSFSSLDIQPPNWIWNFESTFGGVVEYSNGATYGLIHEDAVYQHADQVSFHSLPPKDAGFHCCKAPPFDACVMYTNGSVYNYSSQHSIPWADTFWHMIERLAAEAEASDRGFSQTYKSASGLECEWRREILSVMHEHIIPEASGNLSRCYFSHNLFVIENDTDMCVRGIHDLKFTTPHRTVFDSQGRMHYDY